MKANFAPLTDISAFSGAAVTAAEQQVSWHRWQADKGLCCRPSFLCKGA